MFNPVEITPQNIEYLFQSTTIPKNTKIMITCSNKFLVSGNVLQSTVSRQNNQMLIKLDNIDDVFGYPRYRFFLPYITISRKLVTNKIPVQIPPSIQCKC